jgi:hypothetical protein
MADTAKAVINLANGFEDAERATVASSSAAQRSSGASLWEWIGDDGATIFSY